MKNLTSTLLACMIGCICLHAQVVRPFTVRYNNPSVRGNIVYVSNSIIGTSGSTGTGEMPPAGTSTNNGGAGTYINIESAAVTLFNYGAIWKYYNAGNEPAAQAGPVNWNAAAYTDAAWSSGATEIGFGGTQATTITGQGTFVDNNGNNNDYYQNGIHTAYFRYNLNLASPAAYSNYTLNLIYDDGAVVYVNGTEVGRVAMPAGAVAYTTSASSNTNDATTSFTIPSNLLVAGNNVIAVEVHRYYEIVSGVNRLHRDGTLSMSARLTATTTSSVTSASSADLNLASCSKVLWAGLYWGADQGVSGTNSAWMTGAETSIKVKVPGSAVYQNVSAQVVNYHNSTSSSMAGFNHTGYTAFSEITSLLNVNNANGTYTIADMLGPAGISNSCGGWTIVIAFENPSLVPRNLSVFDGHVIIDGGAPASDIAITGFLTPPSGTVSCELGGVAYDGDRVSQDAFGFRQNGAATFYDLATTAAYPLNGAADAWNSKISYKGAVVTTRNPAYNNTLGYDATIMDLPNTSNAQLSNNQSAATVRFSSPSENYIVHVLTTSISQFNPEFTVTKASTDLNGATLTGGDVLRYRVDYQNVGNDIAANAMVIDNIPSGATYKPGSLLINGVARTDASGDDAAEFDAANNRVVFRVGTGANAASGGQVAVSGSGYVEFDVYVARSCNVLSCANPLSNSARLNYTGNTSLTALYDSSGTTTAGCFTSGAVVTTVSGACFAPRDTFLLNSCPSTSVTFPIELYGGYRFYSSMPFIDANAINPAASYSSTRILYAYWTNGSCHDTVVIRIYITPCPDIDDDNDGLPDYVEMNSATALADHDADGVPNYADAQYPGFVDYNADAINDLFDPSADADNDGTPNFIDADFAGFTDANGDGVHDSFDADSDGIPNHLDLDSDNDGIPDVVESYGVDAGGDGLIDNYTDTDADGLSQNVDAGNTGTTGSGSGLGAVDLDGDGYPNYLDHDSDGDGIPDIIEARGNDANNNGMIDNYADADGDGFHDPYDGDSGNDAIMENAAAALLRTGADNNADGRADSYPYNNIDLNGRPNPYDLDSDGDGLADVLEAGFADADYNGRADGSVNSFGWCTTISALGSLGLPNTDGSGLSNPFDIDADDDGIPDNIEGQITLLYAFAAGADADGDGIDNNYDDISGYGGRGIIPCNIDGDLLPDYLDLDTDGDGLGDLLEGNDLNFNMFPDDNIVLTGTDTDGDGLDDFFDLDNASPEGTSAYMGNGGSLTGDASPGSKTVVQQSYPSYDRDWRALEYILAMQFIDFRGAVQNRKVQLNWTVTNQDDIDHFMVQRSTDQRNFETIASVLKNSAGNDRAAYQAYDDISMVNTNALYYRIIAIHHNGQQKSSAVLPLSRSEDYQLQLQIIPMPVRNVATISVQSKAGGNASFAITDMQGRTVRKFENLVQAGATLLNRNEISELPGGMYMLYMTLQGVTTYYQFHVNK